MSVGYAVDIGGTKLAAARIEDGKIVDRVQVATRTQADAGALLAQGAALLHQLGYRAGASVGIAVTGRVTADGRWNAVNAETLPAVNNAPIARLATELFGTVRLGNDALAAALAEAEVSGAAAGENFAYITGDNKVFLQPEKDALVIAKYNLSAEEKSQLIKRAQSRIGERAFSLIFHNCEHFATWCKTGIHNSEQTNAVWKRVLTTPEFMKYRANNFLIDVFEPKWPKR